MFHLVICTKRSGDSKSGITRRRTLSVIVDRYKTSRFAWHVICLESL